MNILICGGTGMIGTTLSDLLHARGDEVAVLSRSKHDSPKRYHWNIPAGTIDPAALEWSDAVINLAGENIASGLWTRAKRERIHDSRIESTKLLVSAIGAAAKRPQVLLNASAVGIYGDRGAEILTEQSAPGSGFLAEVCKDWESACTEAERFGTRVLRLRIGIVLSKEGGALQKMLLPFKLGLGGRLGAGSQVFPWISLDDAAAAILHCLDHQTLNGPVILSAPNPVSNKEFTKTLARLLKRPAVLPVPAAVLKLLLGDMAKEMLLASIHTMPQVLEESGYSFTHPTLEAALRDILDS